MIDWEKYAIKIDYQASIQIEHYFNDLEKILNDQNLLYKKNEVFKELENHIIDIIRDKRIVKITYVDSLQILTELGPPDEYSDFSTLPGLINSVQRHENSVPHKPIQENLDEITLCNKCNTKNYSSSIFCINCGQQLYQQKYLTNKVTKNSIKQLFLFHPAYFYSWISLFILAIYFIVIQTNYNLSTYILDIFIINELVSIPIFFLFELLNKNSTRFAFLAFFYSYIVKYFGYIVIMFFDIVLPLIFGISYSLADSICAVILIVFPIISTKVLFFSNYATKAKNVLNTRPNRNKILIYSLVEGIIIISTLYLLFFVPHSTSLLFTTILFSLTILGLFVGQEFNTSINITNNQKIKKVFDADEI